jgi:AraC family transcriptional regulator, regulatory protein of adaptative response / methylated-DNA-[protein]-cysteine methyltransferase
MADPRPAPAPAPTLDAETAWEAVLGRDARLDGRLVYAVRTTGVYCRPSCPSRRPRRENVLFFAAPSDAETAGFRACARCGPASGAGLDAVRRAAAYLERHLDERITLRDLAAAVGLSPFHLQRSFRRVYGVSPKAFQDGRRLGRFRARVRAGDPVGVATYEAGFGSSRGLYDVARARLGMTPGAYRRGGAGETIRFTVVPSDLGRVLVAATDRGVCSVALGDDAEPLEAALRGEFPGAAIVRDDAALAALVDEVGRAAAGEAGRAALPLDLRGTAFQLRVWDALRAVPRGRTRTYSELAAAIGAPRAVRAVARACASNPVALVVPCHRIVRGDGGMGGYRWGLDRKRALLERERGIHPGEAPRRRAGHHPPRRP